MMFYNGALRGTLLAKTTVDKSMKEKLHLIRSEFLSFPLM